MTKLKWLVVLVLLLSGCVQTTSDQTLKEDRFKTVYSQGEHTTIMVLEDTWTGVCLILVTSYKKAVELIEAPREVCEAEEVSR